jgi:Tol biopolymer transport system component
MLAAVTAGVLAIGLAIVSGWQFLHSGNVELLQRSLITPMPDTTMAATHVAVSPDGTKLVYQGKKAKGEQSLWIRPLDSLTAQELAGTTGAIYPFWSPDSRFVGFFADGKLKKIDAAGGAVMTLCDAHNGRGGSWSKTGVILFTPASSGGLFQVSEDGGTATEVWTTDKAGTDRYPWFLPAAKSFLFYYT